jgi:hypothetical protein
MTTPKSDDGGLKVYRVEIDLTVYVVAEDHVQAESIAKLAMREEADNALACSYRVTDPDDIDSEWRDSLPYGNHEEKTVEAHLLAERSRR